jgi:translation initiation factor eIF-2B subunit epsilon
VYNLPASNSMSSVSSFSSSILSDDDDTPHPKRASRGSFGTLFSDDGAESTGYSSLTPGGIVSNDFHYDAATSVFDSLQKGDSTDVVQLELVGLRMSNNASESAVRRAIAAAFAKHLSARVESGTTSLSETVQKAFTTYAQIVKRSIFDYERKGDKRPDQVDFLLALQRELSDRPRGREILAVAAQRMYEEELIEEEGFEGWWTDERSAKEGKMAEVRALTERFMTWLRTADEESEEESD